MDPTQKFENQVLNKIKHPVELFGFLHEQWRKNRLGDGPNICDSLISLNRRKRVDFCKLGTSAIQEGYNIFNVMHVLGDAMPRFKLKIGSTIELYEKLYVGTKRDLCAGTRLQHIRNLVHLQPLVSRRILNKLLKTNSDFVSDYIASFYLEFGVLDKIETHKEIVHLCGASPEKVIIGLVRALTGLEYESDKDEKLIVATLSVLADLENKGSELLMPHIVRGYGKLANLTSEAEDAMKRVSGYQNEMVKYAIAEFLFLNAKSYQDIDLIRELLLGLSGVSLKWKGIIEHIDSSLHDLAKNGEWSIVEDFLEGWLINSDWAKAEERLFRVFPCLFESLVSNRKYTERLLTRFFNHDSRKVITGASEIVNDFVVHEFVPPRFCRDVVTSLSYDEILYICRKILGYVFHAQSAFSLTYSILEGSPRKKKVRNLIYTVFVDHFGREYPGSVADFLRSEKSKTRSKSRCEFIDAVLSKIENREQARKDLPMLKETESPTQQTYKIGLAKDKVMQEAMDAAQVGSFVSMIPKVPLKYGRSWFSYVDGNYTAPSNLHHSSVSAVLPISEIYCPVTSAIERSGFRRAKKGD